MIDSTMEKLLGSNQESIRDKLKNDREDIDVLKSKQESTEKKMSRWERELRKLMVKRKFLTYTTYGVGLAYIILIIIQYVNLYK